MGTVKVGVTRIPANSLKYAAMNLGLGPHTPKTGIVRAALALYHGMSFTEAAEMALPRTREISKLTGGDEIIDVIVDVDEELATVPANVGRATAVRIGLALANGWDMEDAQAWAYRQHGGKREKKVA